MMMNIENLRTSPRVELSMEVMSWSGTALVMLSSPGTGREALGTRQIAATISAFVVETERQRNVKQ